MGARLAKSKWHLFPGLIQSASQVFLLGLRAWAEVDEAVEAPVRIRWTGRAAAGSWRSIC